MERSLVRKIRGLSEPHRRSGRVGEDKNFLHPPGFQPLIVQAVTKCL
jgi:hypothetical protein